MTFVAHPIPHGRLETAQEAEVTSLGSFVVISDALPSAIEQLYRPTFATNA